MSNVKLFFVKEHKKEIVIGTVIVVAAVAVVIASSAAATSAAAAGAVAAGTAAETDSSSSSKDASLSHEEQSTPSDQLTENITGDQALKIFDDQITDYQNIISENNLLSPESINLDSNYQDNERIIGSILAHESLNNIPPAFSYEGYDDMLIKGHGVIDNAFSTNQVSSYLDNNIYNSPDQNLKENLYYYQGQEALNNHSYYKAIEDFGKVLEVNPYNPDVYLDRAYTYFEMGDVENSLKDYQAYNEQQGAVLDKYISFSDCIDFSAGIITGIAKGAVGSTKQMLLFAANAITHPLDTSVGIYEGFSNLSKLAVSQEWKLLSQSLAPEVCDLVDQWNNLSMKERGEKSGYIVGKYGADILMPTASAKAISQGVKGAKELVVIVKNLEKTERLMPLEALAGGSSEVFAETVYSWKIAEEAAVCPKQLLGNIERFSSITTKTDILNIIKPKGIWIGKEGTKNYIRLFEGGQSEAMYVFKKLIKDGTPIPIKDSINIYKLPNDIYITYRPKSVSGPPTIDIKLPGLKNNIKLKFLENK